MKRNAIHTVWFAVAALALAACSPEPGGQSGSGTEAGDGGDRITICMLPKKKGVPYFTSCYDGAQAAADALGDVELIYDGPTDGSPEKAASLIERWTLKGVDVIAVSPNDPEVLAPAMVKAREKGIHVITWDADAKPETREFFVNQATAEQIGFALVDAMAADLGGDGATGQVAIITATLTAANQNAWIEHMKRRLPKYPGLELVATKPSNEDQKLAFSIAQDLMKAYPDLTGIFASSAVAFPGAAEAVRQGGRGGQIMVTGLSTPNDMREYVEDGTVRSVILWSTEDLGALTVRAGRALVRGDLQPGAGTLALGDGTSKTIAGDNILLGDILVFTKDNIGDYDF